MQEQYDFFLSNTGCAATIGTFFLIFFKIQSKFGNRLLTKLINHIFWSIKSTVVLTTTYKIDQNHE